jgi:hypothetical protein
MVEELYLASLHFLAPRIIADEVLPRMRSGEEVRILVLDKHLDTHADPRSINPEESVAHIYDGLIYNVRKRLGLNVRIVVDWAVTDVALRILPLIKTRPANVNYIPLTKLANHYTVVDIDIDVVKELEKFARTHTPSLDKIDDPGLRAIELLVQGAYLELTLDEVARLVAKVSPRVLILSNVGDFETVLAKFTEALHLRPKRVTLVWLEDNTVKYLRLQEQVHTA